MLRLTATILLGAMLAGCAQTPAHAPAPADIVGCGLSQGTPDFCDETSWLNTDPLTLEGLRGKVVLVDFWTYSCINCIRTLPHLTAWYDTYKDHGFVLVGVHSPEFEFEKELANVEAAVAKHEINYPVVQDNDFAIWQNYNNRYWPAHYLIDVDGRSITPGEPWHIGEGGYQETEAKIRELLTAAGKNLPPPVEGPDGSGPRGTGVTPELYAGYWRQATAIGNPGGYQHDQVVSHAADGAETEDQIWFDGEWFHGEEALEARSDGRFFLDFKAGAVNMVVAPGAAAGECIEVLLDGQPIPRDLAGPSVNFDGDVPCVLLDGEDSYDLYAGRVERHELSIEAPAGLALYTFAFSRYAG